MTTTPAAPTDFRGWQQHFDEFAPVYERSAFGEAGLTYIGDRESNAVMSALANFEVGRVLDAGAGTGRLSRLFTRHGWRVTALDVSTEMLERLASELPNCQTVHGALGQRLPFDDASFDAVVSMRVLKYVDQMQTAVDELARVLRPGGVAILEFANARSAARFGYPGAPIRFVTVDEAHSMMRRSGLDVTARIAGTRLPFPMWRAARSARAARAVAAVDRAIGACLGARSVTAARSVIFVGQRV